MRGMLSAMGCAIAVGVWCCGAATAAPSGLNVIPTADVLDAGTVSLEYESSGPGRLWDGDCASWALVQVGLGHRVEFGVDHCFDDSDWWGNVKWQALPESAGWPAVAFGVQGLKSGEAAQPYVAVTRGVGKWRVHGGAAMIGRRVRGMAGVDRPIGNRLTVQADYVSGGENSFTYGIAAALTDSLGLTVARTVGNTAETGDGHVVNLAWSISFE